MRSFPKHYQTSTSGRLFRRLCSLKDHLVFINVAHLVLLLLAAPLALCANGPVLLLVHLPEEGDELKDIIV